MSIFKCKMCGGTLEISENQTTTVCDYCGTEQTLPKLDDERRANLYDRANHFRRNNEFDKAMAIYETILNEDATDAEAYWSLVLCRYGIEYVEDPGTKRRIPTVNRAQFTSIFDDDNYKSALANSDLMQKAIYESEAMAINEIQKGILAISQKEDPFDVFICYKETDHNGRRTQDSVLAQELYFQLKNEGFKVFFSRITLEDKLGTAYEPYIFAALNSAKVMVVLGTRPEHFNAVWVKNEWSRYLALVKQSGGKKVLIPAYRDMDPYDLPEEFSHLQAQDMSKLGFMQDLVRGIKKIVKRDEPKTVVKETVKETVVASAATNISPLLKRVFMFLEDNDWDNAKDYCEKVLDQDPENALAYLGKMMVDIHVGERERLSKSRRPFDDNFNYKKVMRFGDEALKRELQECNVIIRKRIEDEQRAEMEKQLSGAYVRLKDGAIYRSDYVPKDTVIPGVIDGQLVTSIGDNAFKGCSDLRSITIPDGVTSIGDSAFEDCSSLTSITIPNNVTSIGDNAFKGCSDLRSITIPNNVTSIGDNAFKGCSDLRSITIPDGVTSIGIGAFEECRSLTSITIPDGVTSIDDYAFYWCNSLTSITIPDGVTSIGDFAFCWCSSLTSITIPDSVTSIAKWAFSDCFRLTSITIPDGVTSIGSCTFKECSSLTSITIPDGVTSIGMCTFNGCSSLTSIAIPDGVTSIDWGAFEGCSSLTSITIPDGVTSIGSHAFKECSSLTSITIPDSVTCFEFGLFGSEYVCENCRRLTSITFKGSKAQWRAIKNNWNFYKRDDGFNKWTIHCTDGDICQW